MNNNQLALLELLKASIFGLIPEFPPEFDWDKVLEEANAQAVTAIAANAIPEEYSAPWKIVIMQNQARFIQVLHGQSQLINLFLIKEIPLVILKGTAVAKYYSNPYLRTMGDVDFLVFPEQFDEAADLLMTNGYKCIQEKGVNPRHMEFIKNGILFELHHHFSSDGFACDSILGKAMFNRIGCELNHYEFPTLPDMENGLVILGHIQQHLKENGLGIRPIIDWMMFVHACLPDDVWEKEFRGLAQVVGLERLAINITKMCKNWLGLPDLITWCDSGNDELVEELLSILFECGNMGRSAGTLRDPVEEVSLQIKRKGLFRWLYDYGCSDWPVAKKYRILIPLSMINGIGKLALKGIKAKMNGTNITEQMAKGNDRHELYKKLGLNYTNRMPEDA